MLDFDDRDLVGHAVEAGFTRLASNCGSPCRTATQPVPWERFLRMSGNPLMPTLGEALERVLDPQGVAEFTDWLRPLVEAGNGRERIAMAYLTAARD